jgi:nucleoside-diphosphate-sugar epimerase
MNEDFNLSTPTSTTVLELAEAIWRRLHGNEPFRFISDPPFRYDVAYRSPDVSKARRVLGFEATTTLDEMLDEVVPWVQSAVERGAI